MVRLMLVLAPVMCILSGIGASSLLVTYMKQVEKGKISDKKLKKFESNYILRSEVSIYFYLTLNFFVNFYINVFYINRLLHSS